MITILDVLAELKAEIDYSNLYDYESNRYSDYYISLLSDKNIPTFIVHLLRAGLQNSWIRHHYALTALNKNSPQHQERMGIIESRLVFDPLLLKLCSLIKGDNVTYALNSDTSVNLMPKGAFIPKKASGLAATKQVKRFITAASLPILDYADDWFLCYNLMLAKYMLMKPWVEQRNTSYSFSERGFYVYEYADQDLYNVISWQVDNLEHDKSEVYKSKRHALSSSFSKRAWEVLK